MDSFYQFNNSGDSQRQPNQSQQQGNQSRAPTQYNSSSGGQPHLQNSSNTLSTGGVNYAHSQQQQQQTHHASQQQIRQDGVRGNDPNFQQHQAQTNNNNMFYNNTPAPSAVMHQSVNVPNPLMGTPPRTADQMALLKSMYHQSSRQQQGNATTGQGSSVSSLNHRNHQIQPQQVQQQRTSTSTASSPLHNYYRHSQSAAPVQQQQQQQPNNVQQGFTSSNQNRSQGYNVPVQNQQYTSTQMNQNGYDQGQQVKRPVMPSQMLQQQQQQQQQQQAQHHVQQQQVYRQAPQQGVPKEQIHHQPQQPQKQSSQKSRFNLTPEGRAALREAVLSAIRNNGDVDPILLQRAMAQGIPKQAILNAAVVARDRDRKNREEKEKKMRQQQQLQQQQQQQSNVFTVGNGQSAVQYGNPNGQQRQQQYQQIAQQQIYNKHQLEKAAAEAALRERQNEETKKKRELQLAQQRELQRRKQEEETRRKQVEAQRLAVEAENKRNAALMEKMRPWGRSSHALVVGQGSKGAEVKSTSSVAPRMAHPNSSWGGITRSIDKTPALLAAYQRRLPQQTKIEGKLANAPHEKVEAFCNQVRQKMIKNKPELLHTADVPKDNNPPQPPTPSQLQLRKRRLAIISTKLINTHPNKRIKLQPKREGRFLEKHIKRARTMTADGIARRHKDLLKAITAHQTEFFKFHKASKTDAAKLARTIRDQLKKAEIQKEKEADQAERARLAALKSNDMGAYTALLEDTKNDRLKFLLDKTDECMNQISTLLASRADEEQADLLKSGGDADPSFSEMVPVSGNYYETAHVKSEQVRQPSILTGGDLKEYQLSGLQWLVSLYNNRLNGILADEMGLGKTIQTISLLAYLMEMKENAGPYLVIVPLSTLSNWVNEFAKWLPSAYVICYKGTPQQRKDLFKNEVLGNHFNVLLTTYEFVIRDKGSLRKLEWQYAIVDEGHRMKNNQSKFAVTLGSQYTTKRRVLLTGTPLQNSLPELWALLNFLLPAIFNSAEDFDSWFNKPFSSFGKTGAVDNADTSEELLSNEERMLIIHRLHELLRPFMLRRVKSEVLDQLPDKVEKVLRCELSSWQKELYKQISTKIIGEAQGKNFNRGLNNVVMQLRKVCNHPYLFSKEGYHINDDIIRSSAKFELLDRILPKLKAAGHRVLMFTQMVKMMPILEDYFAYRGHRSIRLDGSTTADEREKRMYMYNSPDSPYFIFLLSTRAGGLGLNLATADTVIIFDSDWNPMMDLQAQDRAHRIGQRNDVRVFRLITQSPVEEKILGRAAEKLRMNELVVEAGKFDKSGQDEEEGSSLERLKMMELLLTDFDAQNNQPSSGVSSGDDDKDTDDGEDDDGDGGEMLNEMISSNDIDLALYHKIDVSGAAVPALYSDKESIPDWIKFPNGKPEEGSELITDMAADLPHKRKAAQGAVYSDGMTETQFLRMMDKQAVAEEKEKKNRKKKRGRGEVDQSLIIDDYAGRKRAKVAPLDQDTSTTRKKPAAIDESAPLTAEANERLVSLCRSLIYFKEKSTNRKLSEIFLEKPCPATYPDYYQVIDKPIGMNDILRKCRAKLYSNIKEFSEDWHILFTNAATYNGEGSWVAIDATTLKAEFMRLMEKNTTNKAAAAGADPQKKTSSAKKSGKGKSSKKPLRIKLSLKKATSKRNSDDASDSE